MTGNPESRTFGVVPGQRSRFLVLTKSSAASGHKNAGLVELEFGGELCRKVATHVRLHKLPLGDSSKHVAELD